MQQKHSLYQCKNDKQSDISGKKKVLKAGMQQKHSLYQFKNYKQLDIPRRKKFKSINALIHSLS